MLKYEFFIAFRYLKSTKASGFISRISVIALIIVSLAVFLPMLTMSIINGFHESIIEKHINKDYHIQIRKRNLYNYNDTILKIKYSLGDMASKIKLITPFYTGQGLIKYKESKYFGILLRGADPLSYMKDNSFRKHFPIIAGSYDLSNRFSVVIGDKLVRILNPSNNAYAKFMALIRKGKSPIVYFLLSSSNQNNAIGLDRDSLDKVMSNSYDYRASIFRLKVSGVFKSGYVEYDKHLVFSSLKTAQVIYNARITVDNKRYSLASGIGIKLHDRFDADKLKSILYYDLIDYSIRTWQNINKHLIYAFEWESDLMAIILFLMVFVSVVITIFINLNIVVMDKKKEIGILKSFGIRNSVIERIFTVEGFLIGVLGSILGGMLSILFILSLIDIINYFELVINNVFAFLNHYLYFGREVFSKWEFFGGGLGHLKLILYSLNIWDLYILVFLSIFISLTASYFSAKRSTKELISKALKYK